MRAAVARLAVLLRFEAFSELFAMWSLPPPIMDHAQPRDTDGSGPGPTGLAAAQAHQQQMPPPMNSAQALSATLTQTVSWEVGVAEYDAYLRECNLAPDVYARLAEIPLADRLKIMRSTFHIKPEYPESWLMKCCAWEDMVGRTRLGKGRGGPYTACNAQPNARSNAVGYSSPASVAQGFGSFDAAPSPPLGMIERDRVSVSPGRASSPDATVRRSLWSPGPAPQSPPEWVIGMHKNFKNKDKVMSLFRGSIDRDKIVQLSTLPLPMQLYIAFSCMLNPSAWQSVNEYVGRCIATFERLESPGAPAPSFGMQTKSIPLVIITVGYGMGLGHTAVHAALQHVSRGTSTANLQLVGAYSFETDTVAVEVETKIANELGWTLHVCGDASGLVQFVKNNASSWKGCKVLLMTRLPSGKSSTAAGAEVGQTQLHQKGIRLIWPILQVIQHLGAEDKSNILHLADIKAQTNKEDEAWLNKVFGEAFEAPLDFKHFYYNVTTRAHHLRTNYNLRGVGIKHLYNKVDLFQSVDGWQWTPCDGPANCPPPWVLPSAPSKALCKAATQALYDYSALPMRMKVDLKMQTMTHMATQEKRLMSVRMWLHMLSLKDTIVEKVLKEMHPCHGVMLQVNGNPPPAGQANAVGCGTGRWCKQCEESLRMLGKCSHVPLMTDILASLLMAAGESWGNQDVKNFRDIPNEPAHECGPSCAYVTQRK